jgi:raffinose synthase
MYSIETRNNLIAVFNNDNLFMQEIIPIILLDDGHEVNVNLKEMQLTKHTDKFYSYKVHYISTDEKIDLTIQLDTYENRLVAYISANLPIDSFENTSTFQPNCSIKLKVKNLHVSEGFMANYLFSKWWTRPQFGKNISDLMPKTQSLLWKNGTDYHHLLPLSDDQNKTELSAEGNELIISICPYSNGLTSLSSTLFVLGKGEDPYELLKLNTEAGFDVLNSSGKSSKNRNFPGIFEYLGWCTWDAFYHEVDSEKVIKKASEFKDKNLPVKWLMIDDGWSETKDQKLISFKEDKTKFPEGLNQTIKTLKGNFGFEKVGVWHAFTGYWQGIHPESTLATTMKDSLYKTNSGRILPSPFEQKGFSFWNEWHNYLKRQGVDFVKVDNQSALIDFVKYQIPIGEAAKHSHESLEASVGLHFEGTIINCMGMSLEQLWHRPMTALSRNSDDFYPHKEQNFKEHALQNAYNSLYHRNFIWGDWDMWWTKHEHAKNNGVLRAVSGGPVYISDPLEETETEQLWPLILPDGRVLRCDQGGVPSEDCLMKNPNEEAIPLKIWNTSGDSAVIAAFNVNLNSLEVKGEIGPKDIPHLVGNKFIVFDHFKQKTYFLDHNSTIPFTLKDNDVRLFVLTPIKNGFAPCGLLDKYVSPAAIEKIHDYGNKKNIFLKGGGGTFGFYSQVKPNVVLVNGQLTKFNNLDELYTIQIEPVKSEVHIEIIID